MALLQWTLPQLQKLSLPLDESEFEQIVSYASNLPGAEAPQHLKSLLGESPQTLEFIAQFVERREELRAEPHVPDSHGTGNPAHTDGDLDGVAIASLDLKTKNSDTPAELPPDYSTRAGPSSSTGQAAHTNAVIDAAKHRARDEQEMQQELQSLQYKYRIFNSEIEPKHELTTPCYCDVHTYHARKLARVPVQELWASAVMYPGQKFYSDVPGVLFNFSPYSKNIIGSPYNLALVSSVKVPGASFHSSWIRQTIELNERLNRTAQVVVDATEPKASIWEEKPQPTADVATKDAKRTQQPHEKRPRFQNLKRAMHIKSAEEKAAEKATALRHDILAEESGRWPDEETRNIISAYQAKVGMAGKIADLRACCPLQYLHLLRAGYFEPIPVAWADQASNPLKFTVDSVAGWVGITPTWRGYDDLAEERLYWVLNHREGSAGARMKPDFISALKMARERMATAVEPPPLYFSADDVCHVQHTSDGYSKQVMPPPFRPHDRPELATDDSMILLDVSGSMDFDPVRPIYEKYLINGYTASTQPKNKGVARAILRRFIDAVINHDHQAGGYDMVTFANSANYLGTINHGNFTEIWNQVRFGGGTRVMTGWQKVKELHFRKHSESAIHHPVYGWQAGPKTPMLRLLLLLDGEATDMDEFELDLLGLSWAHVTIFLIGVDGCPHHHRHANELQRISDANPHVSFVDAQGNCPERFVTHELLKRHLGYDISVREFEEMEQPPPYIESS